MAGYFDLFTSLFGGAYIAGKLSNNKRKDSEFKYKQYEFSEICNSLEPPKELIDSLSNALVEGGEVSGDSAVLQEVSGDLERIFGSDWNKRFKRYEFATVMQNHYRQDVFYDPWVSALAILLAKRGYVRVSVMGYNTTPSPLDRDCSSASKVCSYQEMRQYITQTCRTIEKYIQKVRPDIDASLDIVSYNNPTTTVWLKWNVHYNF